MKLTKELTNEKPFCPFTDVTFDNGKNIDIHNNFYFTGIVFNNTANKLTATFKSNIEGEKVLIVFSNIKELEVNFTFNEAYDDKVILDMFSLGESRRYILPEDRYFFIDFENGMHIDCNCEGCILEYESNEE